MVRRLDSDEAREGPRSVKMGPNRGQRFSRKEKKKD